MALETGIDFIESDDDGDNNDTDGIANKPTVAPPLTVDAGKGPSPESRPPLSCFGGAKTDHTIRIIRDLSAACMMTNGGNWPIRINNPHPD